MRWPKRGPLRFAAFLAGSKSSGNYSPRLPGARRGCRRLLASPISRFEVVTQEQFSVVIRRPRSHRLAPTSADTPGGFL